MNYTIENKHLKVEISDKGAEMMSIFGKKTNFEYLWQGNPEFWSGRAYNLFPICGRLTDGKYTYKGNTYEMNLHGFARKTNFNVVKQTKTMIIFNLKSDENTLKQYPFKFDLYIKYTLKGAKVKDEMIVKNPDDKQMIFTVGGHPGFNVPLCDDAKFNEHYLEFKHAKKVKQQIFSERCMNTNTTKDFPLVEDKILKLDHKLFDNDAIFLAEMDDTVTLKTDKSERFVKVHYKDMTHLGFWHAPKTEAPYVCIEPWHGVPALDGVVDDFETKLEMMRLNPNKTYKTFIEISVNE